MHAFTSSSANGCDAVTSIRRVKATYDEPAALNAGQSCCLRARNESARIVPDWIVLGHDHHTLPVMPEYRFESVHASRSGHERGLAVPMQYVRTPVRSAGAAGSPRRTAETRELAALSVFFIGRPDVAARIAAAIPDAGHLGHLREDTRVGARATRTGRRIGRSHGGPRTLLNWEKRGRYHA